MRWESEKIYGDYIFTLKKWEMRNEDINDKQWKSKSRISVLILLEIDPSRSRFIFGGSKFCQLWPTECKTLKLFTFLCNSKKKISMNIIGVLFKKLQEQEALKWGMFTKKKLEMSWSNTDFV